MLRRVTLAAVLAVAAGGSGAAIGLTATAGASTTGWSPTATQAVPTPTGATAIGQLAGSTPIAVSVGLSLRHESTLESFIADASNPSSPEFGAAYTPQSFTATYGPTTSSVDAVTSYLESEGFSDVTVASNNLLVTARGTAADAEAAFDTTLTQYSLDGKDAYANSTAAMVPSSLSGTVVGVLGLNDVFKATPNPERSTSTITAPSTTIGYTPNGFQKAYEATGVATGSKTTIATISAAYMTTVIENLRTEEKANGLPEVPVTVENAGLVNPTTTPTDNVEWDLDSQFATGMADDVSHFYFYDATSLATLTLALVFNQWASQDIAKAASASLGECEYDAYLSGLMMVADESFAEAAAQGQTMFASAGDTGASCAVEDTNGAPDTGPPSVNYPASSPYVVAVGGTTLFTKSTGSYDFELGWDAGGGGLSHFDHSDYWQQEVMPITDKDVPTVSGTPSRGVPDIAMDATLVTGALVYTGSSTPTDVGGTSLSSPLALGAWARIESSYDNRLGFAAPALYGVYLSGTCSTDHVEKVCTTPAFHAPLAGDNGLYPATPGYNYNTGLGSIDTAALVSAIKPFVPKFAPTAPAAPSVTAANAQVTATWVAPTTGGTPITGYTVTSSTGAHSCTWTSGPLSCTVAGLTNGTSYTFTVTATNGVGTSAASAPSAAVTPATVPAKPGAPKATAGKDDASVTWTAPATNGSKITGYTVTSSTGSHSCTWTSGSLTCTVSGLTAGKHYTFTVVAHNALGTSPRSTPSNLVTPVK